MAQISKSQISKGIFGAVVLTLSFGAIQFASGRDLGTQGATGPNGSAETSAPAINRSAKADRAASVARAMIQTQTISLRLNGLADTSVLVRVPLAREASNGSSAPMLIKSGSGRQTEACEPVVSVLTEVARHLAPGRCVT
jgi:hypothetical protein